MKKEEKEKMANIISRANNIVVPSYIKKELGFKDNWQKSISPREKKMVARSALRFKDALRKLSKS